MDRVPGIIESREVFKGRVFSVRIDEVEYDDGSTHRIDVVEHGASVAIVATPASDELILVRQYRHPAGTSLWEIPAGTCEPGETLLDGAGRELREETGFSAGRLTKIGSFWTTPGFCSEIMHFFHADELVQGVTDFDEDERIEVGRFTQQAAWRLVVNGAADAKTVLALFWLEAGRGKIARHAGR